MKISPYTRRRFLAAAGAAAAAPLVVPNTALGRGSLPAPSERITFGMIGTGRQAVLVNMQRQLLGMPDAQIVGLCDVDSWRLNHAAKLVAEAYAERKESGQYKGCRLTGDYQELLAHDDIDAVMISTPDHWHAPMAIDAANAGKHVALEKPIIRTVAEGHAIIEAMQKNRRVFRMDSEMRSKAHLHHMAEIVRNGLLGEITAVRVGVPAGDDVDCPETPDMPVPKELDYKRWQGASTPAPYTVNRVHPPKSFGRPGWMRILEYTDGIITNWGTHFWDIALWCIDAEGTGPVEIQGEGVWPEKGHLWTVLRRFEVEYQMAGGIKLYYENTRNSKISGAVKECTAYVKIEGSKGWIFGSFGKDMLISEPASLIETAPDAFDVRFPLKSDKQDFIDAVKTGGRTLENEQVAHRVTSIGLLGHIAIHQQRKLQWDPELERFPHDDAANRYLDHPIKSIP